MAPPMVAWAFVLAWILSLATMSVGKPTNVGL